MRLAPSARRTPICLRRCAMRGHGHPDDAVCRDEEQGAPRPSASRRAGAPRDSGCSGPRRWSGCSPSAGWPGRAASASRSDHAIALAGLGAHGESRIREGPWRPEGSPNARRWNLPRPAWSAGARRPHDAHLHGIIAGAEVKGLADPLSSGIELVRGGLGDPRSRAAGLGRKVLLGVELPPCPHAAISRALEAWVGTSTGGAW